MHGLDEIIKSIETSNPNVNPTEIYNEGWMTRLLVLYSIQDNLKIGSIDFSSISNWSSEALISSPFIRAQKYREGYTHADIAIGDFVVDYSKKGDIKILNNAKLFGIIEAKMASNLSQKTTYASDYNQASRNLVCIASNTIDKSFCKTFFYVVVPESKINTHKIKQQIELQFLLNQIEKRFSLHSEENEIMNDKYNIIKKITDCDIQVISYEFWISTIKDSNTQKILHNFYQKAKKWNRIE